MSFYIEFRDNLEGNKTLRNTVIPLDKLYEKVDPYHDSYRGLFFYSEEMLKHVAQTGSVSRYNGPSGVKYLVWDFDSTEVEASRTDAVQLLDRLVSQYGLNENEVGIYFSGKKGFHIEIKTDGITVLDNKLDDNIPVYVKRICLSLAEGLKTLDKGIYNHNRLYRIAGTLHNKESEVAGQMVRLFKTRISGNALRTFTIEDIKKSAIKLRVPDLFYPIKDPSKLNAVVDSVVKNVNEVTREANVNLPVINQEGVSDENLAPARVKTCMWRLYQGDYTDGRNNALLRIADHEKKQGKPAEVVKATLYGVVDIMNRRNPAKAKLDPISDHEIDTLVRQAFTSEIDYGCNDFVLDAMCSKKCYLAPKKFNDSKADTVTIAEAYKRSKVFFKEYNANLVNTGFKTVDEKMPLLLSTFNLIVGRPGTGKTSVMLNLLKNASEADMPAIFFNMDMSEEMLIQRAAPIFMYDKNYTGSISGTDFMKAHADNNEALLKKAELAFEKISENVLISSQRSMTVKDIEVEIDRQEKIWGRKIKLVIVDYVQLLKSDKEGHFNDQFNAEALTTLAKNRKICVLGLSQSTGTSTTSGNGDSGEYSFAKGSRAWEEQTSTQINCFRPFKDVAPQYDHIISVRMVKNRLGATDRVDLFFHGASGIVRDLTKEEQLEFEALRQQLKENE